MRKTGARSFGGDLAYISGVNGIHNSGGHRCRSIGSGSVWGVLIAPLFAIGERRAREDGAAAPRRERPWAPASDGRRFG